MDSTMSKEALEKWNDAFNNKVYPGPTQRDSSIRVDVGDEAFKVTWEGKTPADVQKENERTVNDLFKEKEEKIGRVFERDENNLKEKALASGNAKSMVDAGGVFEKQDKEVKGFDQNSLDNNSIKATGIDPETLDRLKKEIDEKEKAHNNEIKHHDTIKGPSLPSMDFVK